LLANGDVSIEHEIVVLKKGVQRTCDEAANSARQDISN
jgi:hypothetical protein